MNKQENISPTNQRLYISPLSTSRGFTLVEVVVILIVVAILALFVAPDLLRWLPNMRLRTAANDLRGNMQKARLSAIKQNSDYAIVFDTTNAADGTYSLCSSSGADADWTTMADNDIIETVQLSKYNSGVQFGQGGAAATQADGDIAFPADNSYVSYGTNGDAHKAIIFDSRGICNAGFAYLEHEKNTISYAIGTQVSGVIMVQKWSEGDWR